MYGVNVSSLFFNLLPPEEKLNEFCSFFNPPVCPFCFLPRGINAQDSHKKIKLQMKQKKIK